MILLHVATDRWYSAWYPDVLLVCAGFIGLYWWLVEPVRKKYDLAEQVENRHVIPYWLAIFTIWLAEGTPLHALSEQFLFSAHMLQHILLALVFPPLFIMGFPNWLLRPVFRIRFIKSLAKILVNPVVGMVLFNAVYSAWHLPGAYQAALYNHNVHLVQHIILVFTAILMWWPIVSRSEDLPPLPGPAQMIYLFFMSVAQIATYGYVTFNNTLLYEFYARAPRIWEVLNPTADQILAGIVMKLGSMLVFVPTLIVIFFRWANREEQSAKLDVAPRNIGNQTTIEQS